MINAKIDTMGTSVQVRTFINKFYHSLLFHIFNFQSVTAIQMVLLSVMPKMALADVKKMLWNQDVINAKMDFGEPQEIVKVILHLTIS